jgi:transposase-like protein
LVSRIQQGRPVAHVARELGISRQTAYKWWGRWRREGDVGLVDRSSRPHHTPTRISRSRERQIEALRRSRKLGPARIGGIVEMPASTVHRVLCRLELNRLSWMDRPSGTVIRRRIEHQRPGQQVQMDIKKLGRIPAGGGWRAWGRGNVVESRATKVGYAFVHSAIDAHTRSSPARHSRTATLYDG